MSVNFVSEAREILGGVRLAYAGLLQALGSPARPADVQGLLQLDKKLAWRVRRVADAIDPIEGASFVPSATSAKRVAQAALARGVRREVVDGVLRATADFERFVAQRADDRSSFDAMAAAASGSLDPILVEARRSAYRANVLIHGRCSDAMVFAFAIAPADRPGHMQAVSLRGQVGLQRLRPEASTVLSRHRFESEGTALAGNRPLDPEAAERFGAPVVGALSDAELPILSHDDRAEGFRETLLAQADMGTGGATSYVLGEVQDALPMDGGVGSLCEIGTPTRRLIHDFLIHEDLQLSPPALRVVANRSATDRWPEAQAPGVLPSDARVADLGTGLGLAGIDLASWGERPTPLALVAQGLGWDAGRMRLHRVVIEHPVQGSVVWLRAPARGIDSPPPGAERDA